MLEQVETCHCAAVKGGTEVLPVLNMTSQIKFQAIMRFPFLLRGANYGKQQQKFF